MKTIVLGGGGVPFGGTGLATLVRLGMTLLKDKTYDHAVRVHQVLDAARRSRSYKPGSKF